jgi:hypothetical protein
MQEDKLEEYKLKIALAKLRNDRIELYEIINNLPKDKELLEFIAETCPIFIAFNYAKTKGMYSKKIEGRVCKEAKELIVHWANKFGGSDKLRTAVCESSDPLHPYLYASLVDKRFHKETYEAVKGTYKFADYCEMIGTC